MDSMDSSIELHKSFVAYFEWVKSKVGFEQFFVGKFMQSKSIFGYAMLSQLFGIMFTGLQWDLNQILKSRVTKC